MWQWQHLAVVDLSENDLLFVPNDLGRLNLKSINISGNPKIRLPDAVGSQGSRGDSPVKKLVVCINACRTLMCPNNTQKIP